MPVSTLDIVQRYKRERDLYEKLAREVHDRSRRIMLDNAIRATYQWRFKDEARLAGKIERKRADLAKGNMPEPTTVEGWFELLTDLAAVRVMNYEESERSNAAAKIAEKFTDVSGTAQPTPIVRDFIDQATGKFYRATHLLVTLPKEDLTSANLSNLEGVVCEVQVCSLLAHVWNEIEHDIVYKQFSGTPGDTEVNLLKALGNETLAGDAVISELIKATSTRAKQQSDQFVDVFDFVSRARELFPNASEFSENAGQLYDELDRMGINNVEKLKELIGKEPEPEAKSLLERLVGSLTSDDKYSLRLNPLSSDLMLMRVLPSKAQDIIDAHPAGRGVGRPPRIASIARRFKELPPPAEDPPQPVTG